MELVTFLDDAPYPRTTFAYKEKTVSGRFAPAASARFIRPDTLCVFLTTQALETIYAKFVRELPKNINVREIIIPPGRSTAELWEIARLVDLHVPPDQDLAFDISHGPLSFSLVGLVAAIYLRTTRDIELRAVLYAAYGIDKDLEQSEHPGTAGRTLTPLYDLCEMLYWLEWFNAIERFNLTGEAARLSRLLKAEKSGLMRQAKGDSQRLAEIGGLSKLSGVLNGMGRALHMIRPDQVVQLSADLPARVDLVRPLFTGRPAELSHGLLVNQMLVNFQELALADPENPANADQVIITQRNLINWYAERELWVEATTLAREWLVSWVMYQLGQLEFKNRRLRSRIENVLGAEAQDYLSAKEQKQTYQPIFLGDLPGNPEFLALWLQLTEVRNDINHAGMRPQPGRPEELITRSKNSIKMINSLPV